MPDVIRKGNRPPLMQPRSRKLLWSFLLRVLHEPHVGVITYIMSLSWLHWWYIRHDHDVWTSNFLFFLGAAVVHCTANTIGWFQLTIVLLLFIFHLATVHRDQTDVAFSSGMCWTPQAVAASGRFQGSRSPLQLGHSIFSLLQHQLLQNKGIFGEWNQ